MLKVDAWACRIYLTWIEKTGQHEDDQKTRQEGERREKDIPALVFVLAAFVAAFVLVSRGLLSEYRYKMAKRLTGSSFGHCERGGKGWDGGG